MWIWRWSELHELNVNLKILILYYNSSLDFIILKNRFPETPLGCGRVPELTTLWPDRSQNLTCFNSSRKNSINMGLRKEGDEMGNPALMERPGMLPIFYILCDTVCWWLHCLMWLVQEKIGHCLPSPVLSRWFLPHSLPQSESLQSPEALQAPRDLSRKFIIPFLCIWWYYLEKHWHDFSPDFIDTETKGGKRKKHF